MEFLRAIWSHIGIDAAGAVSVVLATVVLYLFAAAVLHLVGPRLSATPSVLAFTVTALLGALCARAMLGNSPTMMGALIAVGTLLVLESSLGRISRATRWFRPRRTAAHHAVVVMVEGASRPEALQRRHLTEAQLHSRLRLAGLRHRDEAAAVILEKRGTLTILREGETVDAALLADVVDAHLIPGRFVADPGHVAETAADAPAPRRWWRRIRGARRRSGRS